jgi:hypothetical protein
VTLLLVCGRGWRRKDAASAATAAFIAGAAGGGLFGYAAVSSSPAVKNTALALSPRSTRAVRYQLVCHPCPRACVLRGTAAAPPLLWLFALVAVLHLFALVAVLHGKQNLVQDAGDVLQVAARLARPAPCFDALLTKLCVAQSDLKF